MSTSSTAGAGGATNSKSNSSSASALVSTLVPGGLVAVAFVSIFLLLRPKIKRVYQPRTYIETLRKHEKSDPLPDGKVSWISHFKNFQDEYVLNHQSLDGYLYLRFLKMAFTICFVGCCITWPVLFPVNATGGGGKKELDLLSFANIGADSKNRYYAHAFLSWIFFGFVMWMITKETLTFINIRHAYMLSPFTASRMSSRTVLFTDVPKAYQDKSKLAELFGTSIQRLWLATDCKELTKLVEEVEKDTIKLEKAEIKLSQNAVKAKIKADKKSQKSKQPTRSSQDTEAAIPGSEWLHQKDRPTHRLGKIPLIGKKVDTIEWGREELRRLVPQVAKSQESHAASKETLISAVFVEFTTQAAAQAAYRRMSVRHGPKLNPRAIDTVPDQVIWKNLKIGLKQRATRKLLAQTFIALMILFWAIPVAVVGAISNINYLTEEVSFLSFIDNVPPKILGIITGLLPAVLLSVLMALVPVVCRLFAKLSGEVTTPAVELKTQGWYMAFQVIQVFLVTTFASGAAATVQNILKEPTKATTLLAENLPKASNFFISYFIIQGMSIAAGNLLSIGPLLTFGIIARLLDKSPRKMFDRYIKLTGQGWGSLYPKIGNIAIIAFSYSIIAPLVLGFATIGFLFIYIAARYNAFYVYTNNVNTTGLAYGKVLQQIITGVYIGQVCLLGLFAINQAIGPIVIVAVEIGVTAIYHAIMRSTLKPMYQYLPESYDSTDEGAGPKMLYNQTDQRSYAEEDSNGVAPTASSPPKKPSPGSKFATMLKPLTIRLFNPQTHKSHSTAKSLVPQGNSPVDYLQSTADNAYLNPSITAEAPRLWYVKDDLGISAREVENTKAAVGHGVLVTDEWAHFNEKGKVVWTGRDQIEQQPLWEGRVYY